MKQEFWIFITGDNGIFYPTDETYTDEQAARDEAKALNDDYSERDVELHAEVVEMI